MIYADPHEFITDANRWYLPRLKERVREARDAVREWTIPDPPESFK